LEDDIKVDLKYVGCEHVDWVGGLWTLTFRKGRNVCATYSQLVTAGPVHRTAWDWLVSSLGNWLTSSAFGW
jgi:hypothetical protein